MSRHLIGPKFDEAAHQAIEEICRNLDRKKAYVVEKLALRGLLCYEIDRQLVGDPPCLNAQHSPGHHDGVAPKAGDYINTPHVRVKKPAATKKTNTG